jgi:peptidoglycan/LPS O-acetylase OafA/YrhL
VIITNSINQDKRKLLFLDGLRGMAAIYVMIGHARWLLWEGYAQGYLQHPGDYSFLNKILMYFFALFTYGHEVVLFFFVLSGFVIHLKYAKNLQKSNTPQFSFGNYFYKRVKRIYPPFIFAILLTLLLDSLGKNFNFGIYNGTTPYPLINENIGNSDWSAKSFFGNLLFLFRNYFPLFGTNGPAWSLKYEWWFYMLYPLFLLMGTKKILYPTILMAVLFIASFFPLYWPERLLQDIFSMMITWWLGVLLAEVYAGRIRIKYKYLALAVVVIFFSPMLKTANKILYDLNMAVFFFGLMAFFLALSSSNRLVKAVEKLKIFGDFSYTLYIIHFPILVFLSGWVMKENGNKLPSHFLFVIAGIVTTMVLAYLIHFATELPFMRSKRKELAKDRTTIMEPEIISRH